MTADVLVTLLGCGAGVLIAHLESRRAPIAEHMREQLEGLRERMVKLEQKYLAYPSAGTLIETHIRLESRFEEHEKRMNKIEADNAAKPSGLDT